MASVGAVTSHLPGQPIMNAYINHEKRFAFLEARSVEEASNALAFDGLPFRGELLKASGQVMYGWPLAGSQYQRIPLLSFALFQA